MKNIRIVLIDTTHPGNIGATARAMKTMGLSELYLVNPLDFPHGKATAMASNADDLLAKAVVTEDLEGILSDASIVLGTSARSRKIPWPVLDAHEAGECIVQHAQSAPVVILFGTENKGLTNDQLQRCNYHIQIPANPEYSVLNLASAVQLIAYEIFQSAKDELLNQDHKDFDVIPNATALNNFFLHLEDVLVDIDFLDPENPMQVMPRLKRLFHRAQIEKRELSILRGVLSAVQKKVASQKEVEHEQ